MSALWRIEELSRSELLSLIYHHLPHTRFKDHEIFCAACARGFDGKPDDAYGIVCDRCEAAFADEETP